MQTQFLISRGRMLAAAASEEGVLWGRLLPLVDQNAGGARLARQCTLPSAAPMGLSQRRSIILRYGAVSAVTGTTCHKSNSWNTNSIALNFD